MGLGLLHHGVFGSGSAASQVQVPAKLGDLNALSKFREKRRRKEGDWGCGVVEFIQLRSGPGGRKALVSKKNSRSSWKFSSRHYGPRIVACAVGKSRDGEGDGDGEGEGGGESSPRIFGSSLVAGASSAGSFLHSLWNNGRNGEESSLDSSGGDIGGEGRDGNGGTGGDGSSGGDGSGEFDPSSFETHASNVGEKEESDDEHLDREAGLRGANFRVPLLASLSSAAGDALDGEAPFGDNLIGRKKSFFAAEETDANISSRTSDKGLQGPAGGVFGKIDKAAQDCFNFLGNAGHQERSGSQGRSTGPSRGNENDRDALVEEAAAHAMELMGKRDGDEALAKRSETAALRRLQREAFSDLLRVRERLDKLEFHTGLRHSKTASSLSEGITKTRLKGEVCAGGAFVLLDDHSSRYSRAALEQAGLHTGLDVRFTFETSYRDKDMMITECSAGHSGSDGSILGGPISVTKLVYNSQVSDNLNVVVAPLGARASDITETVNPLQGQALTQFARLGPAMYHHCVGSALGATLRGKTALLSLSQYLSGWGTGSSFSDGPVNSGPLCLSTLAQIMFQPWENSVFSLSAVNRFWPSPPLPSFTGLHWSEMGALVLSKTLHGRQPGSKSPTLGSPREFRDFRTSIDSSAARDPRTSLDNPSGYSANASWGTPYGETERAIITVPETNGSAMQSIAMAGEIDVGANVSLAGWAQVDRGYWLQEGEKREIEWGVSLTKTVGQTAGWGLCVGSSKVNLWNVAGNEDNGFLGAGDASGEPCDMQLQMEAFMKLSMGRGFTIQPGVVYLLNKHSQTPALMLRSSWVL